MLYRVLAAYAVYNPEIGYCQGMNVLAAVLLLARFSEEETFWGLTRLMKEYSVEQMFMAGLPGVRHMIEKFNELFELLLPRLAKHFAKEGIDSTMYVSKWFMTLYGYLISRWFICSSACSHLLVHRSVLPLNLVFKVWEEFLTSGSWTSLLAVGLSLLFLFQGECNLLPHTLFWLALLTGSLHTRRASQTAV